MDVEIREMDQLRVATVHHVGPYRAIGEAFARLEAEAGEAGLIEGPADMLAIYHDDPETTPASELRAEAAMVVPGEAVLPGGLTESVIPGGRYACTTHVGPYEELGDAWSRFMGGWLPESGFRFGDGVSYEAYHNTPGDVAPEELRTELFIPVT